jgi:hypothetical protein
LWLGPVAAHQDGRATLIRHVNGKRRMLRVARVAWEDTRGPIPGDMWVLHKCNVAACVNPDHLYLGTHQDNMRDMALSGIKKRTRVTHCPRGHLYTARYSYSYRNIAQICLICNREKCRAYYQKRKTVLAAAA